MEFYPAMNSSFQKAINTFKNSGGVLRTSEALDAGIHPRTLYKLRDSGEVVELSRGVFQLSPFEASEYSDLVGVSKRVPNGVVCLISALSFFEITTEIPHAVYLAIETGTEKPKIDFPPTRVFSFSKETINAGVENKIISNVRVKIFSMEKTVADCFKFRNKIGLDVAIEALKMCLKRNGSRAKIQEYAEICRVNKIIRPYLEAI
jgi:predicted transcriptional regulator of viral defense system